MGDSCAWVSVRCSSVTLPSASNVSSRSGASSASASARWPTPTAAAIPATFSRSRRVTSISGRGERAVAASMTNAGHAHGLAVVELGQVELELGVLHGIGGQHVHAERRHTPLEAPAQVPRIVHAGPPGGKVSGQTGGDVGEKPAAEELVGALLRS